MIYVSTESLLDVTPAPTLQSVPIATVYFASYRLHTGSLGILPTRDSGQVAIGILSFDMNRMRLVVDLVSLDFAVFSVVRFYTVCKLRRVGSCRV